MPYRVRGVPEPYRVLSPEEALQRDAHLVVVGASEPIAPARLERDLAAFARISDMLFYGVPQP